MSYKTETSNATLNGMLQKLKMIEVITKNISGANSIAYKRRIPESLSFGEVLNEVAMQDNSQGSLKRTNRILDLAIEGNANFLVESPGGLIENRNGNLSLNTKGELIAQDGNPLVILDKTDKLVNLADTEDIKINHNGEIHVDGDFYGRLALKIKDNKPVRIYQGYLEGSNVDLGQEMTALTMIFRSFEASEKTLGMETSVDRDLIEKYGRNV